MAKRVCWLILGLVVMVVTVPCIAWSADPALTNGDFEAGATGWEVFGAAAIGTSFPQGIMPHSGTHAATLPDGPTASMTAAIDQSSVVAPADKPYLSYWVWIDSDEQMCGRDHGSIAVWIGPYEVADKFDLCASTTTHGWVRRVLNYAISSAIPVTVEISTWTSGSVANSTLYVDDLAFVATPPNAVYMPLVVGAR